MATTRFVWFIDLMEKWIFHNFIKYLGEVQNSNPDFV